MARRTLAAMSTASITSISSATEFRALLAEPADVVVDYWAPWCGPCRAIAPAFEQLAAAHPDTRFVKVNVDELPELAAAAGVRSIPFIARFSGGSLAAHAVGLRPASALARDLGLG